MSLPPQIRCRAGCGDVGDPELGYLCLDCHGDRVDAQRDRELQGYIAAKHAAAKHSRGGNSSSISALAAAAAVVDADAVKPPGATTTSPLPKTTTRRGPPSINHERALLDFLDRPREKDATIISREHAFLVRELAIRETNRAQLRKYMLATDADEPVDPREWRRYTFGAPRDVPRHDGVDVATERAAQLKLVCAWRQRTLRKKLETRRQLLQQQAASGHSLRAKLLPTCKPNSNGSNGNSSSRVHVVSTQSQSQPQPQRRETLAAVLHKVVAPARDAAQREVTKRASSLLQAAAWAKPKSDRK